LLEAGVRNGVTEWLLDSDPAIRWQVMRDLLNAPEAEWQKERAKIEAEGWGAKLFSVQDEDGQWAGGAFVPADFTEQKWREEGQAWTSTCWTLAQLRQFGLPPECACARRTIRLIGDNSRWDHAGQRYWDGEVEECINGRTVADGAYFGVDVSPIVERLLGERQEDGGWNCERANGSEVSSFHTTINVLEGLLEYERHGGATPQTQDARRSGEDYLLRRNLFRRLSTGEVADEAFLKLSYPNRWRYDVLRALDYFRDASAFDGTSPDPRLAEAIGYVRSRQLPDGRWVQDWSPRGRVWFEIGDGDGQPSRWITLQALRVLDWWDKARP
jgi:hypothetical protein